MLHPNPPKLILPMPIATRAPITIIQTGKFEGTLKASNTPVIKAEPSKIGRLLLEKKLLNYIFKKRQATTEVRVTMIAPMPKNSTEQMKAGMSAISTPYMFFSIESPL